MRPKAGLCLTIVIAGSDVLRISQISPRDQHSLHVYLLDGGVMTIEADVPPLSY